jgi:hypothetical protein
VDDSGNGGVRRGPEPLSHRRWTGGVDGGGGGGESMAVSVDEGDKAKKGNDGGRRLLWRPGGAGGEEKGLGVRGLAPRGGENGAERGGPRRGGKQLGWPASAPSWRARVASLPCDRRGRRGASDAGVSGGQAGPGDVGPGGQRLGAGGSERERGSVGVGR